jgi:formylglycine-generating enzyme required for sulfatase activity
MSRIEDFCIDRYEAHLVTVDASGTERVHPFTKRPSSDVRYIARATAGASPQAYISRIEAEQACHNADKRLCSVKEWYRACGGKTQQAYPYGTRSEKGRCNVGKPHLLSRLFGGEPRGWGYAEHFNNPMLSAMPGFLAKSGEYSGCVSEAGVYDMVGNLHEWVSDAVDASLRGKLPLSPGISRSVGKNRGHGLFMGGFYSTTSEFGRGCRYVTIGHEPAYHDYSTGFRCCSSAQGS